MGPAFWSTGLIIDDQVFFSGDTRFDASLFNHLPVDLCEMSFHDVQLFNPGTVHASYDELKMLPDNIKKKMYLYHYGIRSKISFLCRMGLPDLLNLGILILLKLQGRYSILKIMSEKLCLIMIGIPGSGKSFHAKKLAEEHSAVYLSADDIRSELTGDAGNNDQNARVFGTLFGRLKSAFNEGKNVMVDNTNYNRKNRKEILSLAKRAGYTVYAYEMTTPHEVSKERNKNRDRVVPDFVYDRMISGYEKPDRNTEYIEKVIPIG